MAERIRSIELEMDSILRELSKETQAAIEARKTSQGFWGPQSGARVDSIVFLAQAQRTAREAHHLLSELHLQVMALRGVMYSAEKENDFWSSAGAGYLDRFIHPMYLKYATIADQVANSHLITVDLDTHIVLEKPKPSPHDETNKLVQEVLELEGGDPIASSV